MLTRGGFRLALAVAAFVVVAAALFAIAGPRDPGASSSPPKLGAILGLRYVEVSTRPLAGALPAVLRHLDAAIGMGPAPSGVCHATGRLDCPEGATAPAGLGATTHAVWPVPHPTQPNRWAVPMPGGAALEYALLRAACIARVDAGAQGACVVLAQFPPVQTALDATWTAADGGSDDAGALAPPALPDDFAGETP